MIIECQTQKTNKRSIHSAKLTNWHLQNRSPEIKMLKTSAFNLGPVKFFLDNLGLKMSDVQHKLAT